MHMNHEYWKARKGDIGHETCIYLLSFQYRVRQPFLWPDRQLRHLTDIFRLNWTLLYRHLWSDLLGLSCFLSNRTSSEEPNRITFPFSTASFDSGFDEFSRLLFAICAWINEKIHPPTIMPISSFSGMGWTARRIKSPSHSCISRVWLLIRIKWVSGRTQIRGEFDGIAQMMTFAAPTAPPRLANLAEIKWDFGSQL